MNSNLSYALSQCDKKHELAQLMSGISEQCWRAQWLIGTEFMLWDCVLSYNGKPVEWGMNEIFPEDILYLKMLSKELNGWWIWDDEITDVKFVSLKEWNYIYNRANCSDDVAVLLDWLEGIEVDDNERRNT